MDSAMIELSGSIDTVAMFDDEVERNLITNQSDMLPIVVAR